MNGFCPRLFSCCCMRHIHAHTLPSKLMYFFLFIIYLLRSAPFGRTRNRSGVSLKLRKSESQGGSDIQTWPRTYLCTCLPCIPPSSSPCPCTLRRRWTGSGCRTPACGGGGSRGRTETIQSTQTTLRIGLQRRKKERRRN
jgi:hypothetical protein